MIALAAALLGSTHTTSLDALGLGAVPARRVPATFEQFLAEVVCMAVRPAVRGVPRLVACDGFGVMHRHGTCALRAVREELFHWVSSLIEDVGSCQRVLEAALLGSLLCETDSDCVYRLAPLFVQDSRPVVLITEAALDRYGRDRILHSLWQSECAAGAGEDREYGALFDEAVERFSKVREAGLRMKLSREMGVRA